MLVLPVWCCSYRPSISLANKIKGKVETRNFLLQPELLHCGIAAFALNWVMEKEGKSAVDFPVFVEVPEH